MKVGGGGTGGGEGRKSGKEVLSLLINDQHVPLPRRQHQHKHKSCSKSALSCPAARMGWPLAGLLFCRLSPLRRARGRREKTISALWVVTLAFLLLWPAMIKLEDPAG